MQLKINGSMEGAARNNAPHRRATTTYGIGLILLVVSALALRADVSCPPIFSDHMVLQRDRPITIWGKANPDEKVSVEFDGNSVSSQASKEGTWTVHLPAHSASATGNTLSIRGQTTLTFTDVLVGEVWVCSGQSNMEKPFGPMKGQKPVDDSEKEIAEANHPLLRFFQVPHYGKTKPGDATMHWLPCTPESLSETKFSAAGYFFGRELTRELGVPVGLIHSSFGGTQIEAWMPPEAFSVHASLAPLATVQYPAWVKGVQATELYQSMIAPLVPYSVRGFLWYQGEANCMMAEGPIYTEKMQALIQSWRNRWHAPDAPFLYAQIAPFDYSRWDKFPKLLTPEALPVFWEAQAKVLAMPHTGMVVTTDLVSNVKDIHPTNKKDVGLRFARLALADTYGKSEIEAHSPQFVSFRSIDKNRLETSFSHTGGSITTQDGKPPSDFSVAGADGKFLPANTEIRGDKVVVWNDEISTPRFIRFAWNEIATPNLRSASGLPVVPFRTDQFPVITERPKS